MKLKKKVQVKNDLGLHIRPAAAITKLLQGFKSKVFFTYNNETVNARSIMAILTLVAKKNADITVTVEGEDAKLLMEQLEAAFNSCFGEKG